MNPKTYLCDVGVAAMPASVRRAEQAFIDRHGRPPTGVELGVDAEQLATWRARVIDPGSKKLLEAVKCLSRREARVLLSHALDRAEFAAIAAAEGISENDVAKVHAAAVAKVRTAMPGTRVCA